MQRDSDWVCVSFTLAAVFNLAGRIKHSVAKETAVLALHFRKIGGKEKNVLDKFS